MDHITVGHITIINNRSISVTLTGNDRGCLEREISAFFRDQLPPRQYRLEFNWFQDGIIVDVSFKTPKLKDEALKLLHSLNNTTGENSRNQFSTPADPLPTPTSVVLQNVVNLDECRVSIILRVTAIGQILTSRILACLSNYIRVQGHARILVRPISSDTFVVPIHTRTKEEKQRIVDRLTPLSGRPLQCSDAEEAAGTGDTSPPAIQESPTRPTIEEDTSTESDLDRPPLDWNNPVTDPLRLHILAPVARTKLQLTYDILDQGPVDHIKFIAQHDYNPPRYSAFVRYLTPAGVTNMRQNLPICRPRPAPYLFASNDRPYFTLCRQCNYRVTTKELENHRELCNIARIRQQGADQVRRIREQEINDLIQDFLGPNMSRPPSPTNSCLIDLDVSMEETENHSDEQQTESPQGPQLDTPSLSVAPLERPDDGLLPQRELHQIFETVQLNDDTVERDLDDDVD